MCLPVKMSLYQGNEGPTNDPGHAVEHLLYDVVVQVLPWGEGFLLESGQLWFVNKFFRRQYLIIVFFSTAMWSRKEK